MATACASRTAEHKGRKYRLLWIGSTKYGYRAHLGFFDGSKDFWCDGNAVRESSGGGHSSGREMCAECGDYPGSVECSDSSGIRALCCRRCASMPSYERSFA